MVAPALIGAGISAIGSIFGGRSRKKAAKAAERKQDILRDETSQLADQGIQATKDDQARALAYRADDEARMRAATGFDLVKLVKDAELSGFNPLTVLNATGGAGYDGRGAVLTSPFIGTAESVFRKADYRAQSAGLALDASNGVTQASGYFGDALSGLGNAFFDLSRDAAQRNHEMAMLRAERQPIASPRRAAGGFAPNRKITASPAGTTARGQNVTQLSYGGRVLPIDSGTSDAEAYSTRYGDSELISTGAGLSVIAADLWGTQTARSIHGPIGAAAQWIDRNGQSWSQKTDRFIAGAWARLGKSTPASGTGDGWSAAGGM